MMKPASARNKRILELRSRGLTLQAIAQQFGLTRERVRQLTSRHTLAPRFMTISNLMARFEVTRYAILQAVEAAGLKNRQLQQGRRLVFSDRDVNRMVQHLNRQATRECIQCGHSFAVRIRSRKRLCSPECFQEHRKRMRHLPDAQRPMSESIRQIYDLLSAEPPGARWVSFSEALQLSGLSKMQLVWLRWRGILACVPTNKRSRFGTPQMLYSARHCEVLRRFLDRTAGAKSTRIGKLP
jgi:hypothetical protein